MGGDIVRSETPQMLYAPLYHQPFGTVVGARQPYGERPSAPATGCGSGSSWRRRTPRSIPHHRHRRPAAPSPCHARRAPGASWVRRPCRPSRPVAGRLPQILTHPFATLAIAGVTRYFLYQPIQVQVNKRTSDVGVARIKGTRNSKKTTTD